MGRYVRRRPAPVEARQYTRETRHDVAAWCGADVVTRGDGHTLCHVLASPGAVNASAAITLGDWVVHENGHFRVIHRALFDGLYEEAT